MAEDEAIRVATRIGYPVIVRPSYVLGGRAMAIVYDDLTLREYMVYAVEAATGTLVWKQRIDTHRAARITGSPVLFEGRLYVPVSSACARCST